MQTVLGNSLHSLRGTLIGKSWHRLSGTFLHFVRGTCFSTFLGTCLQCSLGTWGHRKTGLSATKQNRLPSRIPDGSRSHGIPLRSLSYTSVRTPSQRQSRTPLLGLSCSTRYSEPSSPSRTSSCRRSSIVLRWKCQRPFDNVSL